MKTLRRVDLHRVVVAAFSTAAGCTPDAGSIGGLSGSGDASSGAPNDASTGADETTTMIDDSGGPVLDVHDSDLGVPMPGGECPCAANVDRIHVITSAGQIWRLDTTTLEFEFVLDTQVTAGCSSSLAFSMAIDRDGTAWLQDEFGVLRPLDLNEPTMCAISGLDGEIPASNFGMAFASESVEHPCGNLYGINYAQGPETNFFEIDTETLDITIHWGVTIGEAELTGTAEGRLFAIHQPRGTDGEQIPGLTRLVELDKSNGDVIESTDLDMAITNAYALAHHGGDFYIFTRDGLSANSSRLRLLDYDDSDGNGIRDLTVIMDDVALGAPISGAGVSTCAPIRPEG